MDFSVIIPVHNDGPTVMTAIRSALDQAGLAQVVVVDDGSSDDTLAIVQAIDDPRVAVRSQENAGPGAARNTGAEIATGSHLIFLDADDRFLPDALLTFSSGNGDRSLVRTGAILRETGEPHSITLAKPSRHAFPRGAPLAGSFAISRTLFEEIGGYDPVLRYGENSELLLRAQDTMFRRGEVAAFIGAATVICVRDQVGSRDHYQPHRIVAAERMLTRHASILASDTKTRHDHHAVASELQRTAGDLRGAFGHSLAAVRTRPLAPRSWARLLRIVTQRVRSKR